MTFSLTLSVADLLLLLPEIFLTCWLCLIVIVDFAFPRMSKDQLAFLSVGGLAATFACLMWFDVAHISGTLFANMFVLDRMALFYKMFVQCIGCYGPAEGVMDYGARLMKAFASVIDAREPEEIDRILDGIPDPTGQVYRFNLAGSLLKASRAAWQKE